LKKRKKKREKRSSQPAPFSFEVRAKEREWITVTKKGGRRDSIPTKGENCLNCFQSAQKRKKWGGGNGGAKRKGGKKFVDDPLFLGRQGEPGGEFKRKGGVPPPVHVNEKQREKGGKV